MSDVLILLPFCKGLKFFSAAAMKHSIIRITRQRMTHVLTALRACIHARASPARDAQRSTARFSDSARGSIFLR